MLAPFAELYERREDAEFAGRTLAYLGLPDLIRSKETERDDDWADVRLLEEIQDNRSLAKVRDQASQVAALSQLRSRRGFERAEAAGFFNHKSIVAAALAVTSNAVTIAYLLPLAGKESLQLKELSLEPPVQAALEHVQPGSARHLAIVEAVRLVSTRSQSR